MGKIYTHFQTKTAQKPYPLGLSRTYKAYIGEYPPAVITNTDPPPPPTFLDITAFSGIFLKALLDSTDKLHLYIIYLLNFHCRYC